MNTASPAAWRRVPLVIQSTCSFKQWKHTDTHEPILSVTAQLLTKCGQHDVEHITEVLLEGLQGLDTPRALRVDGRTVHQLPRQAT